MAIMRSAFALAALTLFLLSAPADGQVSIQGLGTVPATLDNARRGDQIAFLDLYRELIEANTTISAGSCTMAAEQMAERLRRSGYPQSDLHRFAQPLHPYEGGLVAILHGIDPQARPMLLVAHLDVVEGKREDQNRGKFRLIETNGHLFGRGAIDDKAHAAIWVDTLIRLRAQGFRPHRDIKLALMCGEGGSGPFNGAEYLVAHERNLIDAEFALNEGVGGRLDSSGRPIALVVEVGQGPRVANILNPIHAAAARVWPGVPIVPAPISNANNGVFLAAAAIPTYGVSGMFIDHDGDDLHGLHERIRVSSLLNGRDFLFSLVKLYALQFN